MVSPSAPRIPLVLASASPRRRELLAEAGYVFEALPPHPAAESEPQTGESPAALVTRLAYQKAADVASRRSPALILACDTVVACRGQILGKPEDRDQARAMLRLLRGSVHEVYSGLCLWQTPENRTATRVAVTRLHMADISDERLEQHLDTGDWAGKAGAFGFQDGHAWLRVEEGSVSNVVGLPTELLAQMLLDWYRVPCKV
jgi:septum formation protein